MRVRSLPGVPNREVERLPCGVISNTAVFEAVIPGAEPGAVTKLGSVA